MTTSSAAQALRELVEPPSMTQAEIARLVGVTRQCVGQWMRGVRTPGEAHRKALWIALRRDPRFHPSKWDAAARRAA